MFVNWQLRELNLKIVFYGPALSGKTTNLEQIHARIDPRRRGQLVSLKTNEDRTLYFDFLQLELAKICNLTPKIHLYTVPGQTYYEASRRLVLRGADGIVFVVDSALNRLSDNLESWENMKMNLAGLGIPLEHLPIIVQFNKQDLPNAMPPSSLRMVLQTNGYPSIDAVALRGQGVLDTLKAAVNGVMNCAQRELA